MARDDGTGVWSWAPSLPSWRGAHDQTPAPSPPPRNEKYSAQLGHRALDRLAERGVDVQGVAHHGVGDVRIHQRDVEVHQLGALGGEHGGAEDAVRLGVDDHLDEAVHIAELAGLAVL